MSEESVNKKSASLYCQFCNQSDSFNPETSYCSRCKKVARTKQTFSKSSLNGLLGFLTQNFILAGSSLIAICPAVYFGTLNWRVIICVWLLSSLVIYYLINSLFLGLRHALLDTPNIKKQASTPITAISLLQKAVTVFIGICVMLPSGIGGVRYFGQEFLVKSCLPCQIEEENYIAAVWLIVAGIDLEKTDGMGKTPLAFAIFKNQNWLAKFLVFLGANIDNEGHANIVNQAIAINGYALPLIVAVDQQNIEMAKFLLDKGADPNRSEYLITTSLPLFIAVEKKRFDIAKLLLKYGADINIRDFHKMSPLLYASRDNKLETVKFLLAEKADVNIATDDDATALYFAVSNANKELVLTLLENGANVDGVALSSKKNPQMPTPLGIAVMQKNVEIGKILLDNGASPHHKDSYGADLLFRVLTTSKLDITRRAYVYYEGLDMFDLLIAYNALDKSQVNKYFLKGDYDIRLIEYFLKQGASINYQDENGKTILHHVAGSSVRTEFLLKHGANPNIKDKLGHTVLQSFVKRVYSFGYSQERKDVFTEPNPDSEYYKSYHMLIKAGAK